MLDLLLACVLILANGEAGPDLLPGPQSAQPAGPVVRAEYFAMHGLPIISNDGAPPLGAQRGVMALRRVDNPGRRLHEREVTFLSDGIRVHHSEEIIGTERRLVWREFRPDGARTWVAEWDTETGDSSTTGYGWRRGIHGTLGWSPEAEKPACGPLELMDRMREGLILPGETLALVEPAAAVLTDVEIFESDGLLEARRTDGSLVCVCPAMPAPSPEARTGTEGGTTAALAGPTKTPSTKGVSFSAGTVLVPLKQEGYARARKRWFVPTRPAHERMLARIPKRR